MLTLPTYICLVLAVSAQRIWELQRSKRNTTALLEQGAYEVGAAHYPIMAALHTIWCSAVSSRRSSSLSYLRSASRSPPSLFAHGSSSPPHRHEHTRARWTLASLCYRRPMWSQAGSSSTSGTQTTWGSFSRLLHCHWCLDAGVLRWDLPSPTVLYSGCVSRRKRRHSPLRIITKSNSRAETGSCRKDNPYEPLRLLLRHGRRCIGQ